MKKQLRYIEHLDFEINMPEGDGGERQTGLFDGSGKSDRWADQRKDGGTSWQWIDR